MPYVYILECADGTFYVGSTSGPLEHRFEQHVTGQVGGYTAKRRPLRLAFAQEYESVAEAHAVERKLHGWSGAKKRALAEGDADRLRALSRRGGRGRRPGDGAGDGSA